MSLESQVNNGLYLKMQKAFIRQEKSNKQYLHIWKGQTGHFCSMKNRGNPKALTFKKKKPFLVLKN